MGNDEQVVLANSMLESMLFDGAQRIDLDIDLGVDKSNSSYVSGMRVNLEKLFNDGSSRGVQEYEQLFASGAQRIFLSDGVTYALKNDFAHIASDKTPIRHLQYDLVVRTHHSP
jgi:hypothetical protein